MARVFRRLGRCRVERTEGDIIGAGRRGRLCEFARIVARHADDPACTHKTPRGRVIGILLSDMDAVDARVRREIGPIVDEQGDPMIAARRMEPPGRLSHRIVVNAFHAELDVGDVAGRERRGQRIGKGVRLEGLGRDEEKPAGGGLLTAGNESGSSTARR